MFRLLLRRHLRTGWGTALVLALVTLLAAAAGTAATRAIGEMRARQVSYATENLMPLLRDVVSLAGDVPAGDPALVAGAVGALEPVSGVPQEPAWDEFLDGMVDLRAAQPAPLRGVLGDPSFAVSSTDPVVTEVVPGNDVDVPQVVLRASARLGQDVRLVEGSWPEATEITAGVNGAEGDEPVQVVVTRDVAHTLGWEVGGVYAVEEWKHPPLRVVGLTEPVAPEATAWYHQPFGRQAQVVPDPEVGNIATAAAYVDPAMIGAVTMRGRTTRLWYPVSTTDLRSDDVVELAAQVRGLTHDSLQIMPGDRVWLQARTQLADVLDQVVRDRAGTDAVLAALVVGPLGALVAVTVLAARLVVERRRSALAVLLARGATGTQLRLLTATEGLVVSVPAAVVGVLLGLLAWPGAVTGTQLLIAGAAALAPALAAAAVTVPRSLRVQRQDLATGKVNRWRRTAELAVVGLAGLAVLLLLRRGLVAGAGSGGVDPLLAATPLLVAAAAAVLAVRVLPLLARGLERLAARRRDLVPFLGAARATRSPAGGIVPALALVLAVSVGASSAVLLSTVDAGVARQAHVELGADLRVTGPVVTPETAADLRGVDGVTEVATVSRLTEGGRLTGSDGRGRPVQVVAVDAAALATVQADVPDAPRGVAALAGSEGAPGDDGALPVVTQFVDGLALGAEGATLQIADRTLDVDVTGTAGSLPGLGGETASVLVDREALVAAFDEEVEPRTALVALAPDADPARVAAAVRDLVPGGTVDDLATTTDDLLDAPAASGITTGATVAVVLAAVLIVLTVAITLVLAAPDRERLLSVLRSMGIRRAESRALVAWEVGPWSLAALLVGALVGVVVPALLRARVDLTSLTGGGPRPALSMSPVLVAAGVVGFVVTVAVGAGVAAVVGRRSASTEQLREAAE